MAKKGELSPFQHPPSAGLIMRCRFVPSTTALHKKSPGYMRTTGARVPKEKDLSDARSANHTRSTNFVTNCHG